nr:hypothetical protein [Cellulosimicrobium sp. CUA-896]
MAVDGADVVVVTDDDPHGEDPAAVRAEVLPGALAARDAARGAAEPRDVVVQEVAPRARAIRETIAAAGPDDTVLVAGRGHEVWQEIAGVDHALDDRVEARAALAARAAGAGRHETTHDLKEHHA